ncbi:ABC transporter permease [Calycomorphotria hydatis]|uniref:Transport permease protein n=1 Tax=Calycomorphotria hydatis TaxID=2528027 RepID=A0A517TCP4_9PLAN|nr:ABC transporter permease [Calycomorphotria hydatis]QDT66144.1 Daunorubicin/doxorubicin resistance ABC transporter permease protein DrrB [Calycomorphotria hydatis]
MSATAPPEPVEAHADAPAKTNTPSPQPVKPSYAAFWLPAWTLAQRELVRFFRQRSRISGAIGQPIIFWILFGAGLEGSFKTPDWAPESMSYQEFFFPGIAVMIVLFTAIYSTISIIEDRKEGFLQGVLIAPVPRLSIVLGKIGGGAAIALIQAAIFLVIGPLLGLVGLGPDLGMQLSLGSALSSLLMIVLLAFGLTALGYCIAWPMESTQGFHAIMMVVLLPMWLLSGAFFPGEHGWIQWIIKLNPLTYGVAGLRRAMYPSGTFADAAGLPSFGFCLAVTATFTVVCIAIAVYLTNKRQSSNAR